MHLSINKLIGNGGIRHILIYIYIYIYKKKDEQTHTLDSDFNAILVFIIPKEHKISVRLQKMNTSMHNFKILMLFQCSYFGARS